MDNPQHIVSLFPQLRDNRYGNAKSENPAIAPTPTSERRNQVYRTEQALLENVRTGNLNYKKALTQAANLSNGIQIADKNPAFSNAISLIIFTSLCTRSAIEGGLSPEIAYSIGDEMYESFILHVHSVQKKIYASVPIVSCMEFIQSFPEEDLSLPVLSKRIGYNEYYLSRKFKKEVGISINDYVKQSRIAYSQTLLKTTDFSISQISQQLHFCSSTHFSTTFQKITGVLPGEYRKNNQHI